MLASLPKGEMRSKIITKRVNIENRPSSIVFIVQDYNHFWWAVAFISSHPCLLVPRPYPSSHQLANTKHCPVLSNKTCLEEEDPTLRQRQHTSYCLGVVLITGSDAFDGALWDIRACRRWEMLPWGTSSGINQHLQQLSIWKASYAWSIALTNASKTLFCANRTVSSMTSFPR
jgi:hypothetical protein